MRNPPIVSSMSERNRPCSCCKAIEFFFSDLPILEITAAAIGINTKVNTVSFTLIPSITKIEKRIVRGSLTKASNPESNEYCTSFTSPTIRDIISPLRCSEKNAIGWLTTFL